MNESKVAIIAALPREIIGLVRGTSPDQALRKRGVSLYRIDGAVIVAAGMGAKRVTLALEAALQEQGIGLVVSTGLAGACSPEIAAGAVIEATIVIDTKTGERFPCVTSGLERVLVTSEAIAGVREKARLHKSYNAMLVDMEAATVARLTLAQGLSFRTIKGVSDAHDFEMESLSQFSDARGHFRTSGFAFHTAFRPRTWSSARRLGRDSNRALSKLWLELRSLIGNAN